MLTSSLDERELQQLLVALRYWHVHRSMGRTRRTDPPFTTDVVDELLAKLTASLPAEQREPRSRSFGSDATAAASRPDAAPEARPKSSTRR